MQQAPTATGFSQRIAAFLMLLLASMATASGTGCTITKSVTDYVHYNEMTDDFVLGWRNHVWSSQAWLEARPCYVDHPHMQAFKRGFIDGYISVASGGNGCPPALPPRCYWSWKYQSPEGQAKVAAYFEGFPMGAAAAEKDGVGNWSQIQVSHVIEGQYTPEYLPERHPEGIRPAPQGYPYDNLPAGAHPFSVQPTGEPTPGMPLPNVRVPALPAAPRPMATPNNAPATLGSPDTDSSAAVPRKSWFSFGRKKPTTTTPNQQPVAQVSYQAPSQQSRGYQVPTPGYNVRR